MRNIRQIFKHNKILMDILEASELIDRLREIGLKTEFLGRVGLVNNTKELTLEDLYQIIDNSELLKNYLSLFKAVNREDVLTKVKKVVKDNYEMNTLGARLINTLIHQYFIKGGKLGDEEIKEITFQRELSF